MKNLLPLSIVLTAASMISCSTGRNLERDKQDPKYHAGESFPIGTSQAHEDPGIAAGASTIAAIFSKDYYKSSTIGGECKFKDAKSVFPLPCRNFKVELTTADGKSLSTKQMDDGGAFSFSVESGKNYLVRVPRAKTFKAYQSGSLERGQKIIIRLEEE